MTIVIPGNAIAKKNSQRIIRLGRLASIRPSNAYDEWEARAILHLVVLQRVMWWPGSYPVELHLFFYRRTQQKFDLSNMIEGVQDVLQKAGVLHDDSMRHVVPVFEHRPEGYGWAVDKANPRTEVTIKQIV